MLRQRLDRLVDLFGRDIGLFRRPLDVLAGDRLGGIEVGTDAVEVFGEHNPTELGVHLGGCNAILTPLFLGQTGIDGAFGEQRKAEPGTVQSVKRKPDPPTRVPWRESTA